MLSKNNILSISNAKHATKVFLSQSAENRGKECHRFWLRLRHALILISNVRTSASKKPDGVNPNSTDIDYYVRKNEGKILWFSADCSVKSAFAYHLQRSVSSNKHIEI